MTALPSDARNRILESLAAGTPLAEVLAMIVRAMSEEVPDALCSILLLDRDGRRLRHGAAPDLPEAYNRALDGFEIGDGQGSCGTAAASGRRVIVEDVTVHPYWAPYLGLASLAGIRSCWSQPILSADGSVLGTFAIYHRDPRTPEPAELALIESAAALARLAIERARDQEALRRSSDRLALALEASGQGLYDYDLHSDEMFVSADFLEALGYAPDRVRTARDWLDDLVHPEDRERAHARYREFLKERHAYYQDEYRVRSSNGRYRWIGAIGRIVEYDAAGEPFRMVGTLLDVTDRRQSEAHRRQLEARLQQSQKLESLGVLAGGVAHDFNNLLGAILGNAELALLDLDPSSGAHSAIEEIVVASRRAAELTRQMLVYAGRARAEMADVDLCSLVREMTEMLRVALPKRAQLRVALGPELPPVHVDSAQLRQLVLNLLLNAADALGGIDGEVTIGTSLMDVDWAWLADAWLGEGCAPGPFVALTVGDTGCGMDRETALRMFEPFFTTKFTGRGLGLAAVLGIVRSHRGAIRVETSAGSGTRITVIVPPSTVRPVAHGAETRRTPVRVAGHGLVLLVDDEDMVLRMGRRMLERLGYEVGVARHGREALEFYQQYADQIVCAVLDLTMPVMDGFETVEALRGLNATLPVVVMSGYSAQDSESRFTRIRADALLEKPFQLDALAHAIARARQGSECRKPLT
jgi:PAS domain S-box-containing protein